MRLLTRPMTVSALWEEMPRPMAGQKGPPPLRYDGFVLALDMLCLMGAVDLRDGLLRRGAP